MFGRPYIRKVRTYPDDLSVGSVDFVNGACIASGDEIVPINIFVDAIDMEVVPSIGAIVTRPSLSWVDGQYRLVWLDMIKTGPLEEESACGDVEFWEESVSRTQASMATIRTLEDGIDNPLLVWTSAPSSKISRHRLVHLDKTRLLVDNLELVLINKLVVPSS
jgi:hypothetical protein